jgi:hypothetical protein
MGQIKILLNFITPDYILRTLLFSGYYLPSYMLLCSYHSSKSHSDPGDIMDDMKIFPGK